MEKKTNARAHWSHGKKVDTSGKKIETDGESECKCQKRTNIKNREIHLPFLLKSLSLARIFLRKYVTSKKELVSRAEIEIEVSWNFNHET